jgi:hypothetical protein
MKRKIIISWIASSVLMFMLSFLWHGVVLNDFIKISYQKELFLSFLFLLYVALGGLMAFAYSFIHNKKAPLTRGLLLGTAGGFIVFLIVFVLGTSFSGHVNSLYVSMDFIWQMIEQGAGGLVVAGIYARIEQREMMFD